MEPGPERTVTIEAFADTIVPGEKRGSDDPAVPGAAAGGGAIAAGAVELLETTTAGLSNVLDDVAMALNGYALGYADEHDIALDGSVPPYVALPLDDRTALVRSLAAPGHPEKEIWISVALFSTMAYDTAAHVHTTEALAADHPGPTATGFAEPDTDELGRLPESPPGRPLSRLHPDTTPSGNLP